MTAWKATLEDAPAIATAWQQAVPDLRKCYSTEVADAPSEAVVRRLMERHPFYIADDGSFLLCEDSAMPWMTPQAGEPAMKQAVTIVVSPGLAAARNAMVDLSRVWFEDALARGYVWAWGIAPRTHWKRLLRYLDENAPYTRYDVEIDGETWSVYTADIPEALKTWR